MPKGLVIMNWDERVGADILGKFPRNIDVTDKTLMQLYAQHEYLGEAGCVSLNVGAMNLISCYSGPEFKLYAILVLEPEEDGFEYEDALVEVNNLACAAKENVSTLKQMIPNYFQRVKAYPTLSDEQRLGLFFSDEVKRMVLERFRKEMIIAQSEIQIWLKDKYRSKVIVDVSSIIDKMLKMGMVKRTSIKGDAQDLLFYVRDVMMLRRPPVELIKDPVGHHLPKTLKKVYIQQVLKFFEEYKWEREDNVKIIDEILLDPACYEVLKLLRIAIVTKNDLEKLKKKGVDDYKKVLKKLYENRMITVLEDDKKTEYYALTSDFFIGQFYPAYHVDTILNHYKQGSRSPQSLLEALSTLKEEYFIQFPKSKRKAVKAQAAHT